MSKSDPGKILTIEVPARPQGQVGTFFDGNFIAEQRATVSTKRPASGSPSPASSEFDDDEERQEFVGSKVRLVESQDSRVGVSCKSQTTRVIVGTQVDVLRNQIKDLEQRKDRQLQSASNCVAMKAEVDPSPLSYQSALWESRQRFQESAKLLEEVRVCVLFGLIRCINRDAKARATNRDLHGQEQTAKGRHNELQATLQAASCQLQQLKESLRPLLEEQVVIPALNLVGYRGRVSKLLNEEQPKIQADWEAKLDGTMRRFQADHQRLDAEIHSLKTQESHTALAAQMPQVDAQVESQMVYYSKSAREQAQGVINRLSLEYQTAQAALARQEDTVSKEWEAKVDALDSELQGVLSTEQDLLTEAAAGTGVPSPLLLLSRYISGYQLSAIAWEGSSLAAVSRRADGQEPSELSDPVRFGAERIRRPSRVPVVPVVDSKPDKFLIPRGEQDRDDALQPLQRAIRKLMQQLLGIKYDYLIGEAVQRGHFATLKLTAGPGKPNLTPFRPCWEDLGGEWNQHLGSHFAQPTACWGRSPAADSCTEAQKRKAWAVNNGRKIRASDGSYSVLLLYQMVKLLSTDGMSSEESTDDGCRVVEKNWRHPDVVQLLRWMDLQRTSDSGAPTKYHRRLRLPHGQTAISLRFPIAGLPVNFYHPVWYNGLASDVKLKLRAVQATPLPLHLLHAPPSSRARLP
ncbi:hypothetical protein C8R46DRAFT_1042139 [Mycena filopes]|nr:hypothetical protein C8R46DRAFT_1042139 [Mycena filopes]